MEHVLNLYSLAEGLQRISSTMSSLFIHESILKHFD
jgi:hypothetical protein